KRIEVPTYVKEIVGDIKRWDERDILFARTDLFEYFGVGSPEYQAYHAAHPEHLQYDTKVNNLTGLGKTGGVDTPMFEAQFEVVRKIATEAFVDGEPAPNKVEMSPERAAEKVKALARFLGADLVGIGPLRQEWVYSHTGRSFGNREGFQPWGTPVDLSHHPNAIAMGFQMDYDLIQTAPDFPTLLATAKGYATGAWVAVQLAEYIRMMGYSARAHHLYNYRVLAVPVAVDCGLGELSRAGYLITKEFGLALRLAIVTTDMPLAHDRPVDLGVQSFCESCKICAENCPIGAIPMGDKVAFNGIKKWKLDEEKCYRYWYAVGTDCSLCMVNCPWTKPRTWFHKLMASLATIKGPHQRWMAEADKLFYGKSKSKPRPSFIDPFQR
ncbi:MAG TPA: reductive dehalogenase, partial [Anaerolineae bacterium]|nr:reductive dehalogenase [Anaerolineae bacterium]